MILDEVDALFDGETNVHVDDMELIISKCNHPHIQRAFFSATLDEKVMDLTESFLSAPYRVSIGRGVCGAANVEQHLIYCGDERGKLLHLMGMIQNGIKPPVLLFVSTNKRIVELKEELKNQQSHLAVEALYEGQSVGDKNEIVTRFRNEKIWFLICNDELSRGMDFLNVNTVIMYDYPVDAKQYIHRIGRTGRADRVGTTYTFWTDVDTAVLSVVVDVMIQSGQEHNVPQWMLRSDAVKQPLDEKQRLTVKLGQTLRGSIRRGGDYLHGTSVLKRNNKRKKHKKHINGSLKHSDKRKLRYGKRAKRRSAGKGRR